MRYLAQLLHDFTKAIFWITSLVLCGIIYQVSTHACLVFDSSNQAKQFLDVLLALQMHKKLDEIVSQIPYLQLNVCFAALGTYKTIHWNNISFCSF